MLTATAAILDATPIQLAYDGACTVLRSLVPDTDRRDGYEPLQDLGDKPVNRLMGAIRTAIGDGSWHVADPIAADALLAGFSTKLKLDDRRARLDTWFAAEHNATVELHAAVEGMRAARDVAPQGGKRKPAKRGPQLVSDPIVVKQLADVAAAAGDSTAAEALNSAAAAGATVVVVAGSLPTPKPAPAPRAPRDQYDGMGLDELLAQVKRIWPDLATSVKNESTLRYKLRRAEKQIAAGQAPVFNVSAPAKPRISLTVERAQQLIGMLSLLERGQPVDPDTYGKLANELVGELTEACSKLSPGPTSGQAGESSTEAA